MDEWSMMSSRSVCLFHHLDRDRIKIREIIRLYAFAILWNNLRVYVCVGWSVIIHSFPSPSEEEGSKATPTVMIPCDVKTQSL